MDNYRSGRRELEEKAFAAAEKHFLAGLSNGDARCAYGLVALSAVASRPMGDALATLEEVLPQIKALAQQDPEAAFIMGRCFETGCAAARSIPTAISWYLRSADLGNADAMFNLGCIYMAQGPEGEKLALEQFLRASALGCRDAAMALAHYYQQHSLTPSGLCGSGHAPGEVPPV